MSCKTRSKNMNLVLLFMLLAVLCNLISGAQQQDANRKAASGSRSSSKTASKAGQAAVPSYSFAVGCTPPTLVAKEPMTASIASLPSGKKPNFIVILTDDQGFDDMGIHQPQKPGSRPTWVNTPNLDKFIRQATEFDNFYVAPMCSQSRAMLLTGRDFPRTGTMLINGGYDYINRDEVTAGKFFGRNGYETAHFGKWHNGRTLGYEPWESGFQDSWQPSSHVHLDNLMRHNGRYVQTKGLMEQDLMDKIIGYLKDRENSAKPFYVYYAPHAIHQGFMRPGQGARWQRPAPEPYKSKYRNMEPKLPSDTAEVWAMLEYMDDVLGRLFDYMDTSPLRDNTYIMIMSDNGAELFPTERKGFDKLRRMPSGMQGFKKSVEEGGIRNYLAVKGPGVPAGITDSSLLSITDVLPTMADLAGLETAAHPQWDGTSFVNLLTNGGVKPATSLRGQSRSNQLQQDRFVFSFGPACWSPDSLPLLGSDRKVLKPQQLLDYDKGGVDGKGFERCIGMRWKNYKWLGETGKVYKLEGTSHIELPCNEVTGSEKEDVASKLSKAARSYFNSLVSEEHSFAKPTFYLGLGDWSVTNILPDGAHERTAGRIELLPNGASGFSKVGDRACWAAEVLKSSNYQVQIMYTSQVQASFELSVGPFSKIQDGSAKSLRARLPVNRNLRTADMGSLDLFASNGPVEICLEMIATSSSGVPVFENLSNIRFTLTGGTRTSDGWVGKGVETEAAETEFSSLRTSDKKPSGSSSSSSSSSHGSSASTVRQPSNLQRPSDTKKVTSEDGPALSSVKPTYDIDWLAQDSVIDTWEEAQQTDLHSHLRATPAMKQVELDALREAALRERINQAKESMAVGEQHLTLAQKENQKWQQVRQKYFWPDGQCQHGPCESLFTPYESEGIYNCAACQPDV